MSPVLAYHGIERRPGAAITSVSPGVFARQLDWLADRGYHFDTLENVLRVDLDHRTLAVTLDDATRDQVEAALPVLRARQIRATLLVISDYVGRRARWDYAGRRRVHADWEELRAWRDAGMGIGSHGATHRDLRRLSDETLACELAGSRAVLSERLDCEVHVVGYPFGRSNRRVRTAAHAAGYRIGLGSRADRDAADPLCLPRVVVTRLDTCLSVEQRLSNSLWGSLERRKQRIIHFWAGGTPLYQRLRNNTGQGPPREAKGQNHAT